jgi:hypothetical protein
MPFSRPTGSFLNGSTMAGPENGCTGAGKVGPTYDPSPYKVVATPFPRDRPPASTSQVPAEDQLAALMPVAVQSLSSAGT